MKKTYRYKILRFSSLSDASEILNSLGEKGWEVFDVLITSPPENTSNITLIVYHLRLVL